MSTKLKLILPVIVGTFLVGGTILAYEKSGVITTPNGNDIERIEIKGTIGSVDGSKINIKEDGSDKEYVISVGPYWNKNINLREGDDIEVVGIFDQSGQKIIAYEINGIVLRHSLSQADWSRKDRPVRKNDRFQERRDFGRGGWGWHGCLGWR